MYVYMCMHADIYGAMLVIKGDVSGLAMWLYRSQNVKCLSRSGSFICSSVSVGCQLYVQTLGKALHCLHQERT